MFFQSSQASGRFPCSKWLELEAVAIAGTQRYQMVRSRHRMQDGVRAVSVENEAGQKTAAFAVSEPTCRMFAPALPANER